MVQIPYRFVQVCVSKGKARKGRPPGCCCWHLRAWDWEVWWKWGGLALPVYFFVRNYVMYFEKQQIMKAFSFFLSFFK